MMKNNIVFKEIDQIFENKKINNPKELKAALKNLSFNINDLREDLLFPEDLPYGRTLLYQSSNFEAILMNWKPKNESNIHDHGPSYGCVFMVDGEVLNIIVNDQNKEVEVIKCTKGTISEVPQGIYHQIKNTTDNFAVTLHFYAPPIVGMKVKDKIDFKKEYIVKSDSGAWDPSSNQIIETL
jgi:cysteine dioxygenase